MRTAAIGCRPFFSLKADLLSPERPFCMPFGRVWHFRLESRLSFVQFVVLSARMLGNTGVTITPEGSFGVTEPCHLLDAANSGVESTREIVALSDRLKSQAH